MTYFFIIILSCILIFIIGIKLSLFISLPLNIFIILFFAFLNLKLDSQDMVFFWVYAILMLISAVCGTFLKMYSTDNSNNDHHNQ